MNPHTCNVCGTPFDAPAYVSPTAVSITSLCEVLDRRTAVFYCPSCGHLMTPEMGNLGSYYDDQYKILIGSEDEDQLYELSAAGEPIFRSDHQLQRLLEKVPLPEGVRALDWGCAKGATFRRLGALRPDLQLHLFDVSEMYVPFWERFAASSRWATYAPPPEWAGTFALVTSFYSLEHVAEPRRVVADMARLLAAGGRLYVIVPDTYQNVGDFVVVDHVNHFSAWSLRRLLEDAGLAVLEIDATVHQSALVAIAEKRTAPAVVASPPPGDLARTVGEIANFWRGFGERVRTEESRRPQCPAAIYGSGFYGTFISACLASLDAIAVFVDQNPFRQGLTLRGKPIVGPAALPAEVELVYVGLNPQRARAEIAKISAWNARPLEIFYP